MTGYELISRYFTGFSCNTIYLQSANLVSISSWYVWNIGFTCIFLKLKVYVIAESQVAANAPFYSLLTYTLWSRVFEVSQAQNYNLE